MLSHKARYALRALIALAQEEPGVQLTSADISTRADAPRKFLEAILLQLSLTGLVISKRGKYGGYRLGRVARDISFAEVIRIVDGPLALAPCVSRMAFRKCDDCPSLETCLLRDALLRTRDATSGILEGYSLADALAAEPIPAP
jgi:Rrf2 family protein